MKGNKFILSFIKKNIFSLICLLLFLLVLAMGSISYAKYIIKGTNNSYTNVGSFYFETSIDDVSGLSFTNTAFWSESGSDKIALNALRNLTFSVSNYEKNEPTKVTDVKLKYNLSFAAPKNFVEVMAMQLFNNKNEAIIPQIVLSDLINSSDTKTYKTSESIDYNGTDYKDLEFSVNKYDKLIIASSNSVTITLEEFTKEIEQTLLFRMWDVSMLTSDSIKELSSEGGKVLTPLEIIFNETVEFYKITISVDDFILPAKTETKDTYTIKLAPTKIVSDTHLGGVIVDGENKVSSIYGDETKKWTFSHGITKSEVIIKQVKWSKLENGEIKYYTYNKDNPLSFFEKSIQKIYFSECYSKNYPFYTNVIFEQTQ